MEPVDLLVCTVINEDNEVSYAVVENPSSELQEILEQNILWLAYGFDDEHNLPEALNEYLAICKYSDSFPITEVRAASNPRVITVYI